MRDITFDVSRLTKKVDNMNSWLKLFLQTVIIIAVPVVLIVMPVRVLMHPRYVHWEYAKPGFPPDEFGFTPAERTRLAVIGIESIIGPRGVAVLEQAHLADGSPAFNAREVSHMQDVRVVTANIYFAQVVLLLAAALALAALGRGEPRAAAGALLRGALLTAGLLVALVAFILVGFDVFFTTFHRIFFSGDTWLFSYTDTLIRMYPVQLWFDAATLIGVASIVEAAVVGALAWRWSRAIK
jgi:integral membrane protein (TIGR01906 family)